MRTHVRIIVVVLAALSASVHAAPAEQVEYQAIFMKDAKIGHNRSVRTVADGKVTHRSQMSMAISRGGMAIQVTVVGVTVETLAGEPLSFLSETSLGMLGAQKKSGKIKDGQIHVTTEMMGTNQQSVMPYPAGALMPEGTSLALKKHGLKPGTKLTLVSFDPSSLSGVRQDMVVRGEQDVVLIGRTARLTVVDSIVTVGALTTKAVSYYDEQCKLLMEEMDLMGMKIEMVSCD